MELLEHFGRLGARVFAGQAQRRLPACWGRLQAHAGALLLGIRLVERQPTVAVDFSPRETPPIPAALRSGG